MSATNACLALAVAIALTGCSSPDEGGGNDDETSGAVASICTQDRDVFERCGYTKFDTRAECETAFGAASDADLELGERYYDCLADCTSPADLAATQERCASIIDGIDRAPCEMTCAALSGVPCAGVTLDACLSGCFATYGRCPVEVSALASCGPTYTCASDGTLLSMGCESEQAAVSTCYNAG